MADPRSVEEKVASYREKYPQRVATLNAIIAPLLGFHARMKVSEETLANVVAPAVDRIIAASWGLE